MYLLHPAQVAYTVYLFFGPTLVADLMTGKPPVVVFSYGLVGKFHGEIWEVIGTPDTLLLSLTHLILSAAPLTLWVSCVIGRRIVEAKRCNGKPQTEPSSGIGSVLGPVSGPQVAALVSIAFVAVRLGYIKAHAMMGPLALLVSPGFAWAVPAALLLVAVAHRRGEAEACLPLPPKGE